MSILDKPYFQGRKNNGVLWEPDANCVLWYPGQDDAYSATIRDRSGQGNDGTITDATWIRNGRGVWVQSFNGSSAKVAVGEVLTSGNWSVVMWVYSVVQDLTVHYPFQSSATSGMFFGGVANGGGYNNAWGYYDGTTVNKPSTMASGAWYQIGLTMGTSGTVCKYYENGAYLTGKDRTFGNATYPSDVIFGTRATLWLEGYLALERISNKLLTAEDFANFYQQDRPLLGV